MTRKVSRVQCVTSALFHDVSVRALSTGIYALYYRIGPNWPDLFLCSLSRHVLSMENKRTKAKLAVIESAGNIGLVLRIHQQSPVSRSLQLHPVDSSIMIPHWVLPRSHRVIMHSRSSLIGLGRLPCGSDDSLWPLCHPPPGHSSP
jgi:hypothetical protein